MNKYLLLLVSFVFFTDQSLCHDDIQFETSDIYFHKASSLAAVPQNASVSAGTFCYARQPDGIHVLLGKRDDDRGWCTFGGEADLEDQSLACLAARETQEESVGFVAPHHRELRRKPFHDHWSGSPKSPSLFRLYFLEIPFNKAECFNERLEKVKDYTSKEYTEFAWVKLDTLLTQSDVPLLAEMRTLLTPIFEKLLNAMKQRNLFANWVNQAYWGSVEGVPHYERAAVYSDYALGMEAYALRKVAEDEMLKRVQPLLGQLPEHDSCQSAERELAPSEKHLALALADAFTDPRTAKDPKEAHTKNLQHYLTGDCPHVQRMPNGGGEHRNPSEDLAHQAAKQAAALFEAEAERQDAYRAHYHGTQGETLFLYAVWQQQRAQIIRRHQLPFPLRGHELFFHGEALQSSSQIADPMFYWGTNNARFFCVNAVLAAEVMDTSTTSSSLNYWMNNHSIMGDSTKQFYREAAYLLGMAGDFTPYLSLYLQHIACLGGNQGANGGMIQLFIPNINKDVSVYWGCNGRDCPEKNWSQVEERLKKGVPSERRLYISEGRVNLHPSNKMHIHGAYLYPPSMAVQQQLVYQIRQITAFDMVDSILDGARPFPHSVMEIEGVMPFIAEIDKIKRVGGFARIISDMPDEGHLSSIFEPFYIQNFQPRDHMDAQAYEQLLDLRATSVLATHAVSEDLDREKILVSLSLAGDMELLDFLLAQLTKEDGGSIDEPKLLKDYLDERTQRLILATFEPEIKAHEYHKKEYDYFKRHFAPTVMATYEEKEVAYHSPLDVPFQRTFLAMREHIGIPMFTSHWSIYGIDKEIRDQFAIEYLRQGGAVNENILSFLPDSMRPKPKRSDCRKYINIYDISFYGMSFSDTLKLMQVVWENTNGFAHDIYHLLDKNKEQNPQNFVKLLEHVCATEEMHNVLRYYYQVEAGVFFPDVEIHGFTVRELCAFKSKYLKGPAKMWHEEDLAKMKELKEKTA